MTTTQPRPTGALTRPSEPQRVVASYETYAEAERAVDLLADRGFPVQKVTIVGRGLSLVERVVGRLGYPQAALSGAITGGALGALAGWIVGLFDVVDPIVTSARLALVGLVIGAVIGLIIAVTQLALTRGRRNFASLAGFEAERYEVLVQEDAAEEARRILLEAGLQAQVQDATSA